MFSNVFLTDEQSQENMPQMFLVDEKAHTLAKKTKLAEKCFRIMRKRREDKTNEKGVERTPANRNSGQQYDSLNCKFSPVPRWLKRAKNDMKASFQLMMIKLKARRTDEIRFLRGRLCISSVPLFLIRLVVAFYFPGLWERKIVAWMLARTSNFPFANCAWCRCSVLMLYSVPLKSSRYICNDARLSSVVM